MKPATPQSYSADHIREQIDYWRLQGDTEQVAVWASIACLGIEKLEVDIQFLKAKLNISECAFKMAIDLLQEQRNHGRKPRN